MKRKEPTQSERLMRALLRGAKVDRYYALNKLQIAHPGARVEEIRGDWNTHARNVSVYLMVPVYPIKTIRDGIKSYYWISPNHRPAIREWWEGRKK